MAADHDVAAYVVSLCVELQKLAETADMQVLALILAMAALEASRGKAASATASTWGFYPSRPAQQRHIAARKHTNQTHLDLDQNRARQSQNKGKRKITRKMKRGRGRE